MQEYGSSVDTRPLVNKIPLRNKLQRISRNKQMKVAAVDDQVCELMSLAVQIRLKSIIEGMIQYADHRNRTHIDNLYRAPSLTSELAHSFMEREMEKRRRVEVEKKRREEEKERLRNGQMQAEKDKRGGGESKGGGAQKDDLTSSTSNANLVIQSLIAGGGSKSSTSLSTLSSSGGSSSGGGATAAGRKGASAMNLSSLSSSSSLSSLSAGNSGANDDATSNSSVLGKRASSVTLTKRELIAHLEQESLMCKSKVLHTIYLR